MKRFSEFLIEKLNPKIVEDILKNKDFRIGFEFEFYNKTAFSAITSHANKDDSVDIRDFANKLDRAFRKNEIERNIRSDDFILLVDKNQKELKNLKELEENEPTIEDEEERKNFFDTIQTLIDELEDFDQDDIYDTWNNDDFQEKVTNKLDDSGHLRYVDLISFDDKFEKEEDFLDSLVNLDEVYNDSSITEMQYDTLLDHLVSHFSSVTQSEIETEINRGLLFGDDGLSIFRIFNNIVNDIVDFADMLEKVDEINFDTFGDYYYDSGSLPNIISQQGYDVEFDTAPQQGDQWMITTDPSVDFSEGGVEMISPPVDIQTAIKYLEEMFEYIKDNGNTRSYSSRQCGLHINISLKNKMDNVDPIKFLLFSDEKQVNNVKLFGDRKYANYIGVVYDKLFSATLPRISELKSIPTSEKLKKFKEMIEHEFVNFMNVKYQNINFSSLKIYYVQEKKRIEIRYFGGEDYEKKLELAKKVLFEMLFALDVATDETKMVDEYKTRLLRLMSNLERRSAKVAKPLKARLEKFKTQKLIERAIKANPNQKVQLYDMIHTIWKIAVSKFAHQGEYTNFVNGRHPLAVGIRKVLSEFEVDAQTSTKIRKLIDGKKEDYKVPLVDFVHVILSKDVYDESFVTKTFLPNLSLN